MPLSSIPPPTDLAPERPAAVPATGAALRDVLRSLPSPVVVVTTETDAGPRGATIGSFTSVSLDPPLVSFNVTHATQLHDALSEVADRAPEVWDPACGAGTFAIHLLAAGQAEVATHFAVPDVDGEDQLAPFGHVRGDGPPLLRGSLGVLVCRPHARFEAGDHTVFVGEVTHVVEGAGREPLLYYRQSYRAVGAEV